MSAPPTMPPLEYMIDAANREGYFEFAYTQLGKETAALYRELQRTRDALAVANARVDELEAHVGEWRQLAMKYGTMTVAEKRPKVGQLYGTLTLDREMVMRSGGEAITFACADLARKLRKEAGR